MQMMGGVLDHFRSSAWYYLTPVLACVPIGVLRTYFNQHLRRPVRRLLPFLDPFVTIDIAAKPEDYSFSYQGKVKSSDAYAEVLAYLSAVCSREARELRAEGAAEGHGFVLSLREGQVVADDFKGVTISWSAVAEEKTTWRASGRCCRLTFHERHRRLVVDEYLPHVRRAGQEVMFGNRPRRLYSNKKELSYHSRRDEVWSYIDFDHPTTFDTLAMDPAKKQMIMDDLDDFSNSKDYYRRIGKAWKRGYLLHGPPGTGKSTMIAAMANYLKYDIYDIELTTLETNSDLRKLFIETTGKSIIVIEDIDCSIDLTGSRATMLPPPPAHDDAAEGGYDKSGGKRRNILTLSGLLNFIDGLWSAHSGERIIVFTTNHLDKLDPALIRRGRMDMHIEMSYCGFEAFKTLANNYLEVEAHPLFGAVEELLRDVEMTPADVAECLMPSKRSARDADACLARLIDQLKGKAAEKDKESEAAEEDDVQDAAKEEDERETEKVPSKSKKDKSEVASKPTRRVMTNGAHTTGATGVSVSSSTDDYLS
ncbi:AAA-ATPase At3g28600 [Aegilops tauschii subsp. strangulata]|uniref:AAA+ ATPase domain-containing protein n=2 Tax=Aegilops tauschii subsp. strangulata TaxID=200361 RepID=A0A453FW67_AEGTS|nr:AAA-ATPase At3g28600 [Aegilops tauschii subsp. strangulata]